MSQVNRWIFKIAVAGDRTARPAVRRDIKDAFARARLGDYIDQFFIRFKRKLDELHTGAHNHIRMAAALDRYCEI